jgi:hypothetical protein
MNMKEVKEVAKKIGIQSGKMKKVDLIRSIQLAEGNSPCYQTGILNSCDQVNCCWRSDCM